MDEWPAESTIQSTSRIPQSAWLRSTRRAARFPDDEARRDDDALRAIDVAFERVQQQFGGVTPLIAARPADGRERHLQEIGERDVARADYGDVVGNTQSGFPDCFHRADGRR